MLAFIRFVGPNHALELFGVKLVGINAHNGRKLLFTIAFILAAFVVGKLLRLLAHMIFAGHRHERIRFWVHQGIRLLMALIVIIGIVSTWFDDPGRLTTFLGLVTAGFAFALQRVITALAGYIVILRGKTFNVGDRITMGGVRGDVIALGFIQTTIMEMGQPPSIASQADPAMWVLARQYTGRIVTVTNDKIFDEPVYNYTRDFPYIWDEMHFPISYKDNRKRAEEILLDAAHRHTVRIEEMSEEAIKEMERRYLLRRTDIHARVYWRLTDNWIELSLRFVCHDHGVRDLKDKLSREILDAFDQAGISIASGTYEIVGVPPLRIVHEVSPANR